MQADFPLLKNCCISCSGLNHNEKNDIHQRVQQLGGKISPSLTTSVSHLVVRSSDVRSEKYIVSQRASIPAVSPEFITECEKEASRRRKTVCDDDDITNIVKEITERTRLAPFTGCRICTTGFSVEQRDEMKRLVTTRIGRDDSLYKRYVDHQSELLTIGGSGSYHGELTPECTHLIAVGPTGQKYKFACQWKISIVSLEWFKKTVTTGFLQDEKEFGIKGRALESPGEASGSQELRTPQNAKRSDSMQPSMVPQTRASELAPDSSFHSDIGSRPVTRNRTAAGSIATDSYDLRLGLTGPLSIDDDDDDDLNVIPIDPLPVTRPATTSSAVAAIASDARRQPSTLNHLSSPLPPHTEGTESLFDSCRIALSEASLSTARRKEWRTKIAEAGGIWIAEGALDRHIRHLAARNSQQSGRQAFCTHFVVDDSDELCDEDVAVLHALERASGPPDQLIGSMPGHLKLTGASSLSSIGHFEPPIVVQSGWLRACWKERRRVDETGYSIPWPTVTTTATTTAAAAARQETVDTVPVPSSGKADSQALAGPAHHSLVSANVTQKGSEKRTRGAESMVGRPIGTAWEEPDPFMVDRNGAETNHGNTLDMPSDMLLGRKRQRTSQHQDLLRRSDHGSVSGGRQHMSSYMSSPLNFDLSSLHQSDSRPNPIHDAPHSLPPVDNTLSRSAIVDPSGAKGDSVQNKPDLANIFAHCKFTSLGFSAKAVATLERVVSDHGGSYISLLDYLPAPLISQQGSNALKSEASLRLALGALAFTADGDDVSDIYVVMQLEGSPEVQCCESVCGNYPFMRVVTECWIEQCLQEGVRYPDYYALAETQDVCAGLSKGQHALFRPVRRHEIKGTGSMLLSISGYEGIERDHIGRLAAVLKIPFSERFSRQTTHLICHPPFKGPKYDRAIKWGIPVIESSWLYDLAVYGALECDRRMEVVPEESAGIEVGRRAEAITGHRSMPPPPSVVRKAVQSPAAAAMVTTPVSINKGRTPLKTPLSKVSQREAPNGTPEVTPMDVSLDHNMQQAIDRLSTSTDTMHATPTRVSGILLPPDLHTANKHGDSDGSLKQVLSGVVIALTTRLYHRRSELTEVAMELGCRVLPRFDPAATTHLVHQSTREHETLRDYRTAIQGGISVVSPWWLYACRDMRERMRERDYPYIYQPERRLRLVATSPEEPLPPASTSTTVLAPSNIGMARSRASSRMEKAVEPVSTTVHILPGGSGGQTSSRSHGQAYENISSGTAAAATAAAIPPVPIPPVVASTSAIGSLFGEKVARTRRRYRQAATSGQANPAASTSRVAGNSVWPAGSPKRVTAPSSSEGSEAQLLRNGQATRSSSLHDAACPAPVLPSEAGGKWWRNVGQQSVSPYDTGFPTDLYSQDFQFGNSGGVDRRISLGDIEVSPESVKAIQADGVPGQQAGQRADTPTNQHANIANQQPEPLVSSPLAAEMTTIVYREDADALSERDKFLQQLNGEH